MLDFEQARRRVYDALRPTWPGDVGDLVVETGGLADTTHFAVFHHATDADPALLPGYAAMVAWVDRTTGDIDWLPLWHDIPRLDRMEPVGTPTASA